MLLSFVMLSALALFFVRFGAMTVTVHVLSVCLGVVAILAALVGAVMLLRAILSRRI